MWGNSVFTVAFCSINLVIFNVIIKKQNKEEKRKLSCVQLLRTTEVRVQLPSQRGPGGAGRLVEGPRKGPGLSSVPTPPAQGGSDPVGL